MIRIADRYERRTPELVPRKRRRVSESPAPAPEAAPAAPETVVVGPFRCPGGLGGANLARLRALVPQCTEELLRSVARFNGELQPAGEFPGRMYDWALTNYFKRYRVVRGPDLVDPYVSYKEAVEFYTRHGFDAFRRGPRVEFELDGRTHATTVAQLYFVRWKDRVDIDWFLRAHRDPIRRHMEAQQRADRRDLAVRRRAAGGRAAAVPRRRRRSRLTAPGPRSPSGAVLPEPRKEPLRVH